MRWHCDRIYFGANRIPFLIILSPHARRTQHRKQNICVWRKKEKKKKEKKKNVRKNM